MISEETVSGSQKHDTHRIRRLEFPHQLMFRKVMEADNGICEAFLELVLGFPIDHIERKAIELPKNATIKSRGVRLDLFVKGSNRMIDLEMQASDAYKLGKRMRYYQGSMDVSELEPGDEPEDLLESYIIFVCRKDPFGRGIPRYELEPRCRQADSLDIGADMHWIVLNASAFALEEDERLRRLLQYISCGTAPHDDPLIRNIADEVERINEVDEEVKVFWTLEDQHRMETRHKVAEGEARGEERYAELAGALAKAGRIEDIERAATDKAYRKQLLQEFGF